MTRYLAALAALAIGAPAFAQEMTVELHNGAGNAPEVILALFGSAASATVTLALAGGHQFVTCDRPVEGLVSSAITVQAPNYMRCQVRHPTSTTAQFSGGTASINGVVKPLVQLGTMWHETFSTTLPVPVDCVVSAWVPGAVTPVTCPANGMQTRTDTRTIVTPSANGGAACPVLSQPVSLTCTPGATPTGAAMLTWTPPTQYENGLPLSVAGYKVYWGTAPGAYTSSVTLNNPGIASHTVQPLAPATWSFVVTALDAAGIESVHSNVASKTIVAVDPPPLTAIDVQTGGTFTTLTSVRRYFVGDQVPITTPVVVGATRYEWEIEHVDNRLIDARSTISRTIQWTPTRSGLFVIRVRPCNANGCAPWLSSVDRGYVAHAWLRAPGF